MPAVHDPVEGSPLAPAASVTVHSVVAAWVLRSTAVTTTVPVGLPRYSGATLTDRVGPAVPKDTVVGVTPTRSVVVVAASTSRAAGAESSEAAKLVSPEYVAVTG